MCKIKIPEFVPKSGMTSPYVVLYITSVLSVCMYVGVKIDTTEAEAAASANTNTGKVVGWLGT